MLQIGMRCDSAVASIYSESSTEIENCEIMFTHEGTMHLCIYSLYTYRGVCICMYVCLWKKKLCPCMSVCMHVHLHVYVNFRFLQLKPVTWKSSPPGCDINGYLVLTREANA